MKYKLTSTFSIKNAIFHINHFVLWKAFLVCPESCALMHSMQAEEPRSPGAGQRRGELPKGQLLTRSFFIGLE